MVTQRCVQEQFLMCYFSTCFAEILFDTIDTKFHTTMIRVGQVGSLFSKEFLLRDAYVYSFAEEHSFSGSVTAVNSL